MNKFKWPLIWMLVIAAVIMSFPWHSVQASGILARARVIQLNDGSKIYIFSGSGSNYPGTRYRYTPEDQRTNTVIYFIGRRIDINQRNQASGGGSPSEAGLFSEEESMINLVNQERTARGLMPLTVDLELMRLARLKSQDMVNLGYFGHQSPTYGSPFDMMKSAGISYRYAGENLAMAPTVEIAHNALMNSPGHRANILNPNYNKIGVGIVKKSTGTLVITQLFIGARQLY